MKISALLGAALAIPAVFAAGAPSGSNGSGPTLDAVVAASRSFITDSPESARAPFVLRDGVVSAFFGADGISLSLSHRGESGGWGLSWSPVGAAAVEPRPDAERPGRVNYFHGNDPSRWRTNLPTWS